MIIGEGLHRFGTIIFNTREGVDYNINVHISFIDRTIQSFNAGFLDNYWTKINPSKYRDGLINLYWSEYNDNVYCISMYQHKGNEFIEPEEFILDRTELEENIGRTIESIKRGKPC